MCALLGEAIASNNIDTTKINIWRKRDIVNKV